MKLVLARLEFHWEMDFLSGGDAPRLFQHQKKERQIVGSEVRGREGKREGDKW